MKKRSILLIAIGIIMSICVSVGMTTLTASADTSTIEYKMGDANLDGTVNTRDVVLIKQSIVGIAELTDKQNVFADTYADGVVNTRDVVLIQQYIVGMDVDLGEAHQHTYSEEWTYNEEYHWHAATCEHDVVADKNAHDFETEITAVTCTTDGYSTYTCATCGYSYIDDYFEATGHKYNADITEPTCTEQGYTTYTCTRCGDSYKDNYVQAHGHDFGEWIETTPPTCTTKGVETRYCSHDHSHTETRETNALGHNYSAPTYTWSADNKTCTAERVCLRDSNHIETETVNTTEDIIQNQSCETDELTTYTAVFTNSAFATQIKENVKTKDKTDHDYGEPVWAWNGYESATATFTCNNDSNHTKTVNASMTIDPLYPTCLEDGHITHYATVSFNTRTYVDIKEEFLPALGHEYDHGVCVRDDAEQVFHATFIADDNTIDVVDFTVSTGKLAEPEIPAKANYVSHWEQYSLILDDITINAVYLYQYTITYNCNGGTAENPVKYTVEDETFALADCVKTGYVFNGWFTTSDYQENSKITEIAKGTTGNITLYAKWIANTYSVTLSDTKKQVEPTFTVSFDGANGSIPSQTVTTTKGLTYPPVPTRSGYVFTGWYTTSNGSTLFDFSAPVTKDVTVYAHWMQNAQQINGEEERIRLPWNTKQYRPFVPLQSGTLKFSVKIYNNNPNIDSQTLLPSAYGIRTVICNEYKNEITGSYSWDAYYYSSDSVSVEAGKLYYISCIREKAGNYPPDVYITLKMTSSYPIAIGGKADGPREHIITQEIDYDSAFALSTDCVKDGYTFMGWYDGIGGTGTQYTDKEGNSIKNWDKTENTTLYAKWTAFTLTTEKNIETAGTVSTYENTNTTAGINKTITATTNDGYTWIGWYNGDELLTDNLSYTFTMPEQDVVYTAKWNVNEYTIIFNSHGGSMVAPITQDYATIIYAPSIPTLEGKSFVGWYDITLSNEFQFDTMPAEDITLYAKWIDYEIIITYSQITKISIDDSINANLFNATATDTDGNPIDVTVEITGGIKAVGNKITVRLFAIGLNDTYAIETISNISIYGLPTLFYNTEKDYINISDTVNASLFNVYAIDTFGDTVPVNVFIKEENYQGGDFVTVVISATDKTHNNTKVEIPNIKVYDTPNITRNISIVDIKESDTICNELFDVYAVDSFGVSLDVDTIQHSGTFSSGNTITIESSTTDSKGNKNHITYSVKVYGAPSISGASTTDFKVEDEITLDALGIIAKDSFANSLTNVSLQLISGSQMSGTTLTYLVTAIDHLGNVNTREISGINIYGEPTITFDTQKLSMKITDEVDDTFFNATARDSFNGNLSVSVTLNTGKIAGGNFVKFKLSAIDHLGNYFEVVSQSIKVYSSDDIVLNYTVSTNNIKITSTGEEFNAQAVNGFGEHCETSILAASGYTIAGGNTINLYIVATDSLGNTKKSELLTGIKIYDTPTLVYTRDYDYIQNGDNPYALFKVLDSFNKELMFDVEIISGSLENNETITYRITAKDKVQNELSKNYTLVVLDTNESILELYKNGVKVGTQRVYKNDNYTLPKEEGSNVAWHFDSTIITNDDGTSLIAWDKDSNGYVLTTDYYTIVFDANCGEVSSNSQMVNFDASYTLPTPKRVGYTFAGWYNGSTLYNGGKWQTTSDITLTAQWTANTNTAYTVKHYQQNILDDEYTLFETQTLTGTSDSSITPNTQTYIGFTSPLEQTMTILPDGTGTIDYYYTRNYYTVTVVGNGGSNNSIVQKYQSAIDTTGWTIREGFTFGGLYNNVSLTSLYADTIMPAEDKTIYAYWEDETRASDFLYTSTTAGVTIDRYRGSSTTVNIPTQIGGISVTEIGANAFVASNAPNIVSIVVPNSVEIIKKGAFKGCTNLTTISVPFIGKSRDATYYEAVFGYIFGYEVDEERIEGSAYPPYGSEEKEFMNKRFGSKHFAGTTWQYSCLTSDYQSGPNTWTYVYNSYCYYIPTSLTTVIITDVVTNIPDAAFFNCRNIESISIRQHRPGSTGAFAFYNCNAKF